MKTKLSLLLALALGSLTIHAATVRIVQTNAAGDSVMLIDPATNTVVAEIGGIEVNHGAAAAPDGSRLYITNEAESTLDVADLKTMKVTKNIPLTNHPNNVAVSKDGTRVYVAIVAGAGAVDVIDTGTLTRVKSIRTEGGIHNTYVTPDGKFVVAGSIPGRKITVIDQKTEEILWTVPTRERVRPIAFETNPHGSTKRIFVQLSGFNGFTRRAEQDEHADLFLLAAGPEAARRVEGRPSSGLADVHAGWQARLCRQRGIEFRVGRRRRDTQGAHADSGRTGAEAEYHGRIAKLKQNTTNPTSWSASSRLACEGCVNLKASRRRSCSPSFGFYFSVFSFDFAKRKSQTRSCETLSAVARPLSSRLKNTVPRPLALNASA